ncbi:MAG: hypothetical protein NTZ69_02295 [Bacteroidia bacterium]|nr:hypothetical protein [Bacteroidia bacterium]
MVKKAIIIQVIILGLLAIKTVNHDFFDVRLKNAQKELDFWQHVRKVAVDTAFFNNIDLSSGRFIIIGWGSDSSEAFPLFSEIVKNQQIFGSYKILAISPFEQRKSDAKRVAPFSGAITFKYNEIDIDKLIRGIPFTTIQEHNEKAIKAKAGKFDMTLDYPVVIILNRNIIIVADKKVIDLTRIALPL